MLTSDIVIDAFVDACTRLFLCCTQRKQDQLTKSEEDQLKKSEKGQLPFPSSSPLVEKWLSTYGSVQFRQQAPPTVQSVTGAIACKWELLAEAIRQFPILQTPGLNMYVPNWTKYGASWREVAFKLPDGEIHFQLAIGQCRLATRPIERFTPETSGDGKFMDDYAHVGIPETMANTIVELVSSAVDRPVHLGSTKQVYGGLRWMDIMLSSRGIKPLFVKLLNVAVSGGEKLTCDERCVVEPNELVTKLGVERACVLFVSVAVIYSDDCPSATAVLRLDECHILPS